MIEMYAAHLTAILNIHMKQQNSTPHTSVIPPVFCSDSSDFLYILNSCRFTWSADDSSAVIHDLNELKYAYNMLFRTPGSIILDNLNFILSINWIYFCLLVF